MIKKKSGADVDQASDTKRKDNSPPKSHLDEVEIVRVVDHVVEQRVSNLAQGLLFVVTMTGPLLIVLHLIPQAVLAGLFFVMGTQALSGNGITLKLLYLFRDRELTDKTSEPLAQLERQKAVWLFTAIELFGFAATFAITQTIAAIGFPVIILILVPVRTFLMPRWFRDEELKALDAPTAGPFVMESVGGAYGADENDLSEHDSDGDESGHGGGAASGLGSVERFPDESAIMEDSDIAERGESFEMRRLPGEGDRRTRDGIRRSHSALQKPGREGVRRRSVSSRGRGVGRPE